MSNSTTPYGYTRKNNIITINENEYAVLSKIFQLAIHDYSKSSIVDFLNANSIKTREDKDWWYTSVSNLLTKERLMFYAGIERPVEKKDYPIILSQKDYLELISKDILFVTDKTKAPLGNIHLLTGLTFCACGKPVKTIKNKAKTLYYGCGTACGNGVYKQVVVNNLVIDKVKQYYANKAVIADLIIDEYKLNLKLKHQSLIELSKQIILQMTKLDMAKSINEFNLIAQQIKDSLDMEINYVSNKFEESMFDFDKIKRTEINKIELSEIDVVKDLIKKFVSKIELVGDMVNIYFKFPVSRIEDGFNNLVTIVIK